MAKMLTYISSDAIVLNEGSFIVEVFDQFLDQNQIVEEITLSKSTNESYIVKKDGWSFEENFTKYEENEKKEVANYSIIYSNELQKNIFLYTYPIVFSSTKWGYLHMSLSLDEYNYRIK